LKNIIKPCFKVEILNNEDESYKEIIPNNIITSISYSENLTDGQRRNLTLTLVNEDNSWSIGVGKRLWIGDKVKLYCGLENIVTGEKEWYPKGIFLIGNCDTNDDPQGNRTITLTCNDKFILFDSNFNTLVDTYVAPIDSTISEAVEDLLLMGRGNGQVYDIVEPYFAPGLGEKKVQAEISVTAGSNASELISEFATQLSSGYYYDENGVLTFLPTQDVIINKALMYNVGWKYEDDDIDIQSLNLNFNVDECINSVTVYSSSDAGVFSYTVNNNDPSSPICVQRIGKKIEYVEAEGLYSNDLCRQRSEYQLWMKSVLACTVNATVAFNPILKVGDMIEVSNNFLELERSFFVIQEISWDANSPGSMNLNITNIEDIPSTT